ncbi:MAG: hypothetical protein ACYCXC_00110 [Acidovorax defluvii]
MPEFYYSPHTGEIINTSTPADWMGKTSVVPPSFNSANQSAFFREGAWAVETAVPVVIVPTSVTPRQARLALLQIGKLDAVSAALTAIPDPARRTAAQVEWEYATVIERNSPLVTSLAAGLGLTAADIEALFEAASRI